MPDARKNFASSLVATAPSPATSGTTLTVTTGQGTRFPAAPFNAVVCPANTQASSTNAEIVRVTAISTDTFTITRQAETGGTSRSITVGDQIYVGVTAKTVADVAQPVPAWAGDPNTLQNMYDQRKHIYNWKPSNTRHIRRGLAYAAKGGLSVHAAIGDSATAGCNSFVGTTLFDRLNAWPLALRNAFAGMGVPIAGTGLMRIVDSNNFTDSVRYSTTGVWVNDYSAMHTTSAVATVSCVPDLGGTILETHYIAFNGGGTFTVAVNGTTVATINSNNGGTSTYVKHRVLLTTPVIANSTTIKLAISTIGSGVYVRGWNVFTPNGGLMMHNLAQSGSYAAAGGTTQQSWTDSNTNSVGVNMKDAPGAARQVTDAVFNGTTTMTSATAAFTAEDVGKPIDFPSGPPAVGIQIPENTTIVSVTSGTSVVLSNTAYGSGTAQTINIGRDPDCIHIELGFNDLSNGTSVSTITAALTTIRNWYPNSDCILHIPQEGAYTLNSQANQDALAAAMYALADTLDVPLFDWRDRLGRYATGNALGVYGDTVHLVPSAYGMMGALLAEVVGESSGKTQSFGQPTQDFDFANKQYVDYVSLEAVNYLAPSTNGYETVPRLWAPGIANIANPAASGRLVLVPIILPKAYSVGHISFASGTTAVSGATHQWFGLYDTNFVQLALTADQTSTAWTANTVKTLAVATTVLGTATSYVTQYTGHYYLGVMVSATVTMPSYLGLAAPNSTVAAIAPAIIAGLSDSSQTTPPAFPHTATTVSGATVIPYAYVTN